MLAAYALLWLFVSGFDKDTPGTPPMIGSGGLPASCTGPCLVVAESPNFPWTGHALELSPGAVVEYHLFPAVWTGSVRVELRFALSDYAELPGIVEVFGPGGVVARIGTLNLPYPSAPNLTAGGIPLAGGYSTYPGNIGSRPFLDLDLDARTWTAWLHHTEPDAGYAPDFSPDYPRPFAPWGSGPVTGLRISNVGPPGNPSTVTVWLDDVKVRRLGWIGGPIPDLFSEDSPDSCGSPSSSEKRRRGLQRTD